MGMGSRKLLLFPPISGGKSWIELNALLYDTFTTPDAAPITSPRTCEPGPGELVVNDTAPVLSIAGGNLVFPTGVVGVGDPAVWLGGAGAAEFTMEPGKAGVWNVTMLTGGAGNQTSSFGFDVSATGNASAPYMKRSADTLVLVDEVGSTDVVAYPFLDNVETTLMMVPRSTAVRFYYISNGILVWPGVDVWPIASTALITANNINGESLIHSMSLLPLADYNAAWGGDWTEVTDTETAPASATLYDCEADFHVTHTFTQETGKFIYLYYRFTDTSNAIRLWVDNATDHLIVSRLDSVGGNGVLLDAGALTDGVSYQADFVAEGSSLKLYLDGVLKGSMTETFNQTVAQARIAHDLATNDIVITTHPYPALGIATSRVVAPQEDDTATHTADCLVEFSNFQISAASAGYYDFRKIDANNRIEVKVLATGSVEIREYVSGSGTRHIQTAGGAVSNNDDVVIVLDGASLELFVNGTSVASSASFTTILTGTQFFFQNDGDADAIPDSIAFFPRDVSSLLPAGTF